LNWCIFLACAGDKQDDNKSCCAGVGEFHT
jgi:hypothetical protein